MNNTATILIVATLAGAVVATTGIEPPPRSKAEIVAAIQDLRARVRQLEAAQPPPRPAVSADYLVERVPGTSVYTTRNGTRLAIVNVKVRNATERILDSTYVLLHAYDRDGDLVETVSLEAAERGEGSTDLHLPMIRPGAAHVLRATMLLQNEPRVDRFAIQTIHAPLPTRSGP